MTIVGRDMITSPFHGGGRLQSLLDVFATVSFPSGAPHLFVVELSDHSLSGTGTSPWM
jgi:hypothetical protein